MASNILKCLVVIISLSWAVCVVLAKPSDEEHKSRVLKNKDLSDEQHFTDGDEHNPDYDHEAFLGEEEARTFDELSPEESKQKLSEIVNKIDADQDGFVTHEELRNWIDYTQKKYIMNDVQAQWSSHNPKNKDKLSWDEYKAVVYGFLDNMDTAELEKDDEGTSYVDMLNRDQRRWQSADKDKDGALTVEEYKDFLHPEESKEMKDIVVQETIEDIDNDKDGKISLNEYIGDMYTGEGDESEPSWVTSEKEQFSKVRDANGDGFMDADEVRQWVIPPDYDHADAEAKHLIYEADSDNDSKLSKAEILDKYDLFVGSQATDFGEALTAHDEF